MLAAIRDGLSAVSYTHLVARAGPEAVADVDAHGKLFRGDVHFNVRIDPVSYTHLDVYKRQVYYRFLPGTGEGARNF